MTKVGINLTRLFLITGGGNHERSLFAHVFAGQLEYYSVPAKIVPVRDIAKVMVLEKAKEMFGHELDYDDFTGDESVEMFMNQQRNTDTLDWAEILFLSLESYSDIGYEVLIVPDIVNINDQLTLTAKTFGVANLVTETENPIVLETTRDMDRTFHVGDDVDIMESGIQYAGMVMEEEIDDGMDELMPYVEEDWRDVI